MVCLSFLQSQGFKVLVEPVSKKFRSRSGYYHVACTIALMHGDSVICALQYNSEIIPFLETTLREGLGFLTRIPVIKVPDRRRRTTVPEKEILNEFANNLLSLGYEVFVNVKHNNLAREEPIYFFQPDADIVAVKNGVILGFKVKGSKGEKPTLEQVYTGLGEALFYLVNPVGFNYMGKEIPGGVFDKVYLLLPTLPAEDRNLVVSLVSKIGLVGFITFDEGVIIEPPVNPFLNIEKKKILLENIYVLDHYRRWSQGY